MRNLRAVLFVFSATVSSVLAQGARTQITVDWIYSPAPHAISAMPESRWLADGRLLLAENGRLDVLDPVSLERGPFLDARAATRSLRQVTGLPFQSMPDIEELSENGSRALWNFDGSLVAMDLTTLVATRITDGTAGDFNSRLSPDGSRVAFNRGSDLYVYTFATETLTRLSTDGSETIKNGTLPWVYWEEIYGRQDLGYFWSPDSKRLAYLRSDESLVTEVAHLDFRGQVPEIHRQRYPKAGTSNPIVRLGVVDLDSAPVTTRWVDLGANTYEYLVRVKWLPTSDRLSAQTLDRAHQNLDLWFVDVATGAGRKILSEHDEGWINIHDDLDFLPDNEHFLWVSERTGYSHLYRYRMDGTLVNAVTTGEWAMKGASPIFWLRRAVAGIDSATGYVYFGSLMENPRGTDLYRVRMDGTGLEKVSKVPGTHTIKMRPDGRYFVDEHSSATRPPAMDLCDGSGAVRASLVEPRQELVDALDLVLPEHFTIATEDGFPMPAYIYKPKNFDATKSYPLILYTYGGPSSRSVTDEWDFDRYFNQILLQEGFLVACVDNRSATGVSKRAENTIRLQMTGDGELKDLLDGVRWFKNQSYVDKERVGIWGWSNGGMMTLLAMTRSVAFKAGISVAPVTDWTYYDTIWAETVMKTPADNPKGYEHTNLWQRAKDLSGRLLLVHGTYDDNVHIQNTWHFVHELVRAGKMFDLMVYPMRQHGISDRSARVHLYTRMIEFWKAHLK